MKPRVLIAEAQLPDDGRLQLAEEGGGLVIRTKDGVLMSSRQHGSEEEMARIGCERLKDVKKPRVLVGGLGMGFTLRAALDLLPASAEVVVSELLPIVVEWNQTHLAHLAKHPLADKRVKVILGDVLTHVESAHGRYDAILLDVDNGPSAFTTGTNNQLYAQRGLRMFSQAVRNEGKFVVWSAEECEPFGSWLERARFIASSERVRARGPGKGARHILYVGTKLPERFPAAKKKPTE